MPDDNIERLRASRKQYDDNQRAQGRADAADWVQVASWRELLDVSTWVDQEVPQLWDGHSFGHWANNRQMPDLDMSEPYWQGFVDAAEEYRSQVEA